MIRAFTRADGEWEKCQPAWLNGRDVDWDDTLLHDAERRIKFLIFLNFLLRNQFTCAHIVVSSFNTVYQLGTMYVIEENLQNSSVFKIYLLTEDTSGSTAATSSIVCKCTSAIERREHVLLNRKVLEALFILQSTLSTIHDTSGTTWILDYWSTYKLYWKHNLWYLVQLLTEEIEQIF